MPQKIIDGKLVLGNAWKIDPIGWDAALNFSHESIRVLFTQKLKLDEKKVKIGNPQNKSADAGLNEAKSKPLMFRKSRKKDSPVDNPTDSSMKRTSSDRWNLLLMIERLFGLKQIV